MEMCNSYFRETLPLIKYQALPAYTVFPQKAQKILTRDTLLRLGLIFLINYVLRNQLF